MDRMTIYKVFNNNCDGCPISYVSDHDEEEEAQDAEKGITYEPIEILLPEGFHMGEDQFGWHLIFKENCLAYYRPVAAANDFATPEDMIDIYLLGGYPEEIVPVKQVKPYYFTFGWNDGVHEDFPYEHTYLTVYAENEKQAVEKFNEKYHMTENGFVNCSFWYPPEKFDTCIGKYYHDGPAEIIQ